MFGGNMPNGYGLMDPAAIPPPGLYSGQRAGVQVNLKTALQIDAVMTSCRVISNALTMLGDPVAYTESLNGDNVPFRELLDEQPAILTNTWGPGIFQFDGMSRTATSLALFSEAFWYTLERDALGYPSCLEVLNPALVEIKKDGRVYYGSGSSKVELNPENLTHIPFMMLPGAQRGLNSIEYAGAVFAIALAAIEYGSRWFAQGASPSFILSTEQKLGQEEVKRIAEKFLIEHSGLSAAHLPVVVDSGLKVDKIQSTPDESQYLQTLEYARRVIAAYFGLPSHLVGGMQNSSSVWGGTIEQQGIQMVQFTLSGFITRINQAYSSLLPKKTKAALITDPLTVPDSQTLARLIQMIRLGGVLTANEIRVKYFGLGPKPGGDELISPLNSNTSPFVGQVFAEEIEDDYDLKPPTAPGPNPSPANSEAPAGSSGGASDGGDNAGM